MRWCRAKACGAFPPLKGYGDSSAVIAMASDAGSMAQAGADAHFMECCFVCRCSNYSASTSVK